jgi:phosphoenolpyruvate-protein phosphotransferase (PTS system enzyme I)
VTFSLHGIGVSDKIAIGKAHLLAHVSLEAQHYLVGVDAIVSETARFDAAVKKVQDEFTVLRAGLDSDAPHEMSAMLDVHSMIAHDEMLVQASRDLISQYRYNAEWALSEQVNELVEQFEAFEDDYLRERKQDVMQVGTRIMRALREKNSRFSDKAKPQAFEHDTILVAHDIAPADMLQFKDRALAGFITDLGGTTSHTAIVARGLGVPAVVATGQARDLIREDEWLIIDGENGVVLVNPDDLLMNHYRLLQIEQQTQQAGLSNLVGQNTLTKDGREIKLYANIELPDDVDKVREVDADGVGLFRSEFLFLNRAHLPDENEQFEAYKSVAFALKGKPVTIRTLDIGADKSLSTDDYVVPPNPALGLRAVRYSLARPDMFLTQLRAILRASAYGQIKLLLPMISGVEQLRAALVLIEQAREQLREANIPFDTRMAIGIMIEIPSAVLVLPSLLPLIDFVSVGTNDLTQYTLAVDRADSDVAHLYNETHPAVLQLIARTIITARKAKKSVSVCGEMAGDAKLTRLLLGFGLREFSMQAAQILTVKDRVMNTSAKKMRKLADAVLECGEHADIRVRIKEINALKM